MLILSRRVGEKILIGDDVEVTVVRVVGDQVRIGIRAPSHVSVDREEVRERKANLDSTMDVPLARVSE